MMAARGALAMLFGLAIVLWPSVTLSIVVALFGGYAVLDGALAVAAALRVSEGRLEAWPVALEGAVSLALGALALGWPFVSRELVYLIAGWGIVIGVLEVLAALAVSPRVAGHWLLATGGGFSLFVAVLILMLPHAALETVALIIGIYAILAGVLVTLAAVGFRAGTPGPGTGEPVPAA
jgi:uncharacterized membrane protein HdeD (DUF308 family)